MIVKIKISTLLIGLFLTTFSFGQITEPKEYLGVPGPIIFDGVSYNLAWTSNPYDDYYKQEYIEKGDTLEKFKKMVILEFISGKIRLKSLVGSKVAELNKMKASNPIVNYETFEKDGEIMLDFLISQNSSDGKSLSIIERNVYRYKSIVDKDGKKGVLLFAVSERAYEDDIDKFFQNLKEHRFDLIDLVGAYQIPELQIKNQE